MTERTERLVQFELLRESRCLLDDFSVAHASKAPACYPPASVFLSKLAAFLTCPAGTHILYPALAPLLPGVPGASTLC